jgi:mannan endo-1,4-beta-mannosidase
MIVRPIRIPVLLVACLSAISVPAFATSAFHDFIKVHGDQLIEDGKPFRFISWNIPNLQLIEDNVPFNETNPWRLPDRFELTDALATVRQMGGTVARTYVLSVRRTNDTPEMPRHVLGPGKFNEDAFRALDLAMQVANEQGVRLIIPLVDNWSWQGGRAEYAGWRGKTKDDFWADPQLIADFKRTIHFVLMRTNTYTGVRYCDDPAVLCWETGNELSSPPSWTREISAYIKSLETNHLVMDGFNTSTLRAESLEMRDVDIVTTHHYPGGQKSFVQLIQENAAKAKGRKPYLVGEFGFVSTEKMEETMRAIRDSNAAGGLLWSLRFRNRDGGFYWHSEPYGANLYKAFHWPGSSLGDEYDERKLMALIRRYAFEVRGESEPAVPAPAPPHLLPIEDADAISWQGSVGAQSYVLERAVNATGLWSIAGENIDESFTQYRPLFADETAPKGKWFYRVRAKNESGISESSNVIGPVEIRHASLVDELADFSKVENKSGDWKIANHDCRKAKEDAHRAAGTAGATLIYQRPTQIQKFRVFAFFPHDEVDVKFSVSENGTAYEPISVKKQSPFGGAGDYGYWKPMLFQADGLRESRFLKIELTGETQISRVEIESK